MEFKEFGLILFVERYEECLDFYQNALQLNVIKVKETLVKFELPHGYLMVEQGGKGSEVEKVRGENPTVLRFDVESLELAVKRGSFNENLALVSQKNAGGGHHIFHMLSYRPYIHT